MPYLDRYGTKPQHNGHRSKALDLLFPTALKSSRSREGEVQKWGRGVGTSKPERPGRIRRPYSESAPPKTLNPRSPGSFLTWNPANWKNCTSPTRTGLAVRGKHSQWNWENSSFLNDFVRLRGELTPRARFWSDENRVTTLSFASGNCSSKKIIVVPKK